MCRVYDGCADVARTEYIERTNTASGGEERGGGGAKAKREGNRFKRKVMHTREVG